MIIGSVLSALAGPARQPVRWGLFHGLPAAMMTLAAARGDLQSRLVVDPALRDPDRLQELCDQVRASGPFHRSKFTRMTTSLPVVREVLSSPDVTSGAFRPGSGPVAHLAGWADEPQRLTPISPPSLLVADPPDHTRYRRLVSRVFTARAVEALRERTRQIAEDLLDGLERDQAAAPGEPVDLVERYCGILPLTVISEILGVPAEDLERVRALGAATAPVIDLGLSFGRFRRVEAALDEFDAWLAAHLASLRADPGDDLLSRLVAVRDEEGGLDDVELRSVAGLVLVAGFETTVNLLGNGIALLCEHPDQLARLQEEPDLWSNAVDEVLRVDPPVLLTGRFCVRDTEIAGVPLARGDVVTTILAGANRDPDVFEDPHAFDVARANARDHVSFSSGRHFCLGAALARMEGEVGLRALFDRFPDLVLAPGSRRRATRILRGYAALPSTLGRAV
jgi:cytochrome P450